MILDLRTYDFAPGDALRYLRLFGSEGLPIITRYLPLGGYWMTEVGPLNRLRHIWLYRDMADRAVRRARMMDDAAWTEGFLPRGLALIRRQDSQIVTVTKGSPAFDAMAARADQAHAGLMPDAPLFRAGWVGLLADASSGGNLMAGRIVLGEGAGTLVALTSLAAPSVEPSLIELWRPTAFSPL